MRPHPTTARLGRVAFLLAAALAAGAVLADKRSLPDGPLIAAYASGGECDTAVVTAVQQGLNVVIWSFIVLAADAHGNPVIDDSGAPPAACVAATRRKLASMNLTAIHLISTGGWGAPHPAVTAPGSVPDVYASWTAWNAALAKATGWSDPAGLYDGLDWDIEGVNDLPSPDNLFTPDCLDLMGKFSQMAKADGWVVTMVPPESYLEGGDSTFNLKLNNTYPDFIPAFSYHGANAYAYVLSKYGVTPTGELAFDLVSVQLYESWSRSLQNITYLKQGASEYLEAYVPRFYDGWRVDFSSEPVLNWPSQVVRVNTSQLMIGLANGWTSGEPALLVLPSDLAAGYAALKAKGQAPRGFFFWTIASEGATPPGQSQPLWMAAGLNAFMHVRK